jgi:hypothetical protein
MNINTISAGSGRDKSGNGSLKTDNTDKRLLRSGNKAFHCQNFMPEKCSPAIRLMLHFLTNNQDSD